jgi:hypothetical protein
MAVKVSLEDTHTNAWIPGEVSVTQQKRYDTQALKLGCSHLAL